MRFKIFFVTIVLAVQLICVKKSHADDCRFNTLVCDEGAISSSEFMPTYGTIIAYDNDQGKRYVYNAFYWSSYDSHSWFHSNPYFTLEPDILFTGGTPYTTDFDPPFEWGSGAYNPSSAIVITNLPCPYADAVLDDDIPTITVGSACAHKFETGKNYFSYSRVNKNSEEGYLWARYQRGMWGLTPARTYIPAPVCIENNAEPVWEIAPACIYSCCTEFPNQINNVKVIYDDSPFEVPGCADWKWVDGQSVPVRCREKQCTDGTDNDLDGLTDCDDPDCSGSPDCTTLIDPPEDPCSTVVSGNGYYCGSDDELRDYPGNDDDLVYCYDDVTISVEYCENGCEENDPTQDAYCIPETCTPVCSAGQTQCNGNDVEICSADQCSFEFAYTCGSNQTCSNGTCITPTAPAPVINSVSCTSYFRGDTNVTCTIHGSNFDCLPGSNSFIAGLDNGPALSCTSNQIVVSGYWDCNQVLGFKQVSHRNADNQRDDRTDLLELLMGDLFITYAWQEEVNEWATNVEMGANGCNFGPNVVLFVEGIDITNTHLQAEDQVIGYGEATWPAGSSPSMLCVAKYSGAAIGPDKQCLYNYVTIIP